jgi:hypothetical protein
MATLVPAVVIAGGGYLLGLLDLQQTALAAVVLTLVLGQLMGGGNADAAKLVGNEAPDVTLTEVATGETKQLSEYFKSGRPTLIDFYQCAATSPPPARAGAAPQPPHLYHTRRAAPRRLATSGCARWPVGARAPVAPSRRG